MNRIMRIGGLLLAGVLTAGAQTNLVIEAIEHHGAITFNTLTNAQSYRVEWSPNAGASWSSFTAAAETLDQIETSGVSSVTVAVPMLYRVVATVTDPQAVVDPLTNMVLIPAGSFVMGHASNVFPASEGIYTEMPQRTVQISAFYIDRFEVTRDLWDEVKTFADNNGYTFSSPPNSKDTNHPVVAVSWYDAVKWCNARSEWAGLTPVYYLDGSFTTPYRLGDIEPEVDWSADGYRLPTEAEWEKAARGGVPYTRFAWSDHTNNISWDKANYTKLTPGEPYDAGGGEGYHPTFDGAFPNTSPVGYFAPNDYGLYDMIGNAAEWCWDWFDDNYYSYSPGTDPRGPTGAFLRKTIRGGSFALSAFNCRVAGRLDIPPGNVGQAAYVGFRCVKRP